MRSFLRTNSSHRLSRLGKLLPVTALIISGITACHPTPGPDKAVAGAILGAGWGAGTGAVIGHQVDHAGSGAAIGSGFGFAGGLIHGAGLDLAERSQLKQKRSLDSLQVRVASNHRALSDLQHSLDARSVALQASGANQVFFDSNRASLRSGSAGQLQRLAGQIKRSPWVTGIVIHGHSDDTGDTERNRRLSEARARTVVTFLVNQGVNLDIISLESHGASRPLASNETESGRQLNRRAEVVFIN